MYSKEIVTNPNIIKFWNSTINRGAHLIVPQGVHPKCWERRLSITWEYVYSNRTGEAIGLDYDITREGVRKITQKTTYLAWKQNPKHARSRYPLHSFGAIKLMNRLNGNGS